jgi:hypothetical protein
MGQYSKKTQKSTYFTTQNTYTNKPQGGKKRERERGEERKEKETFMFLQNTHTQNWAIQAKTLIN